MAEKIVEVPGVGNVSFPDTMADTDIAAAIQKQLGNTAAPKPTPAPPDQPSLVGGFLSEAKANAKKLYGAVMNTAPEAEAPNIFQPGNLAPLKPYIGSTLTSILENAPSMATPGAPNLTMASPVADILKASPAGQIVGGIAKLGQKAGILNGDLSPAQQIEQKLAPSGNQGKRTAMDVSKALADNPELMKAPSGPAFDRTLFWEHQAAGKEVRAAEAAIPDSTPVDTRFIHVAADDLIDRYKGLGANDAVNALESQKGRIPTQEMPWDQFSGFKRRLGNDLDKSGVWRRIMNDTATEKDHALAQLYGRFMEATSGISDPLAQANQKFATYHDALRAAGIDTQTGRRIADVGKDLPASLAARAGKVAIKAGGTAAVGGAGYEIWKILHPGE